MKATPLPDWHRYAECAGYPDPDLFWPARGESTAAAKAICFECAVAEECLNWAIENCERYGVWGGTSEYERRRIRQRKWRQRREARERLQVLDGVL